MYRNGTVSGCPISLPKYRKVVSQSHPSLSLPCSVEKCNRRADGGNRPPLPSFPTPPLDLLLQTRLRIWRGQRRDASPPAPDLSTGGGGAARDSQIQRWRSAELGSKLEKREIWILDTELEHGFNGGRRCGGDDDS